ncbi:MAG: HAMP domain-containing protein [Ectothiorhodospiraceae bacterium]|nr:HAMP domain-containing protein [Ectothiorhodospiraceae bacterium]
MTPTASSRRPSIGTRLAVALGITLALFLAVVALALERAFEEESLALVRERHEALLYMLLAPAEPDETGRLRLPDDLPEPRLSIPGSGLYAMVTDGAGDPVWRSRSTLGADAAPVPRPAVAGTIVFAPGDDRIASALLVRWEGSDGRDTDYVFEVQEEAGGFDARSARFRRHLWYWLAGLAVIALLVQTLTLRWALAPLRRVTREVAAIEAGERQALSTDLPRELTPLADAMNALIDAGRRRIERSRNALADLAHSLKTPLAVLRSSAASVADRSLASTLDEQVDRIDRAVDYQLQRAAASGRQALSPPVDVARVAARLCDAMRKVHATRGLDIALAAPGDCRFRADEGDLTELVGNLLDNACKWARRAVRVRIALVPPQATTGEDAAVPPDLVIEVEDDGPGFGAAPAVLLRRGGRADERADGQGIGLAVVDEIVRDLYDGSLLLTRGALGGALVRARLPGTPARSPRLDPQ